MMATENSVLFALKELQSIEAERMTQEADVARQAIEEAAAAQVAQAVAEQDAERRRQDVAEAEARLRLDAETEAHERAARIAKLQADLDTVQNDRARLHQLALVAGSAAPLPEPRSAAWPMAFAAMTALAMALSAWLIVRTPEVQVREVLVSAPAVEAPAAPAAEALEEAVVAEAIEAPPAVEEATSPERVRPRVRPRPRVDMTGFERIEGCDNDDPLCGI